MKTRIWKEHQTKSGKWIMDKDSLRVVDIEYKGVEWTQAIADVEKHPPTPYANQGPPIYVQRKRVRRK